MVYFPEEALEPWITAYDSPDRAIWDGQHLFLKGFDEFLPGQLWAGAHPAFDFEIQKRMISDLLSQGVRCFLDLTTPTEFHARHPYQQALEHASEAAGVAAERVHFPLRFRTAPTAKRISELLELIRARIDRGQGVYLHAGHNLEGRAPLVLACLLIQQGVSSDQAIGRVTDFWLQVMPYLFQLPLTDRQRRFVLQGMRPG